MILNNNTEFYGHALLVNGSGDSFVGTHTVLVSRRTASMSRSASKSKLAGSVGSKGKKESVAPDEVQPGSHGNVVGTVTGGVTTSVFFWYTQPCVAMQ